MVSETCTICLTILKHPLEGTHHRADDDAWNIAAILARLISS